MDDMLGGKQWVQKKPQNGQGTGLSQASINVPKNENLLSKAVITIGKGNKLNLDMDNT